MNKRLFRAFLGAGIAVVVFGLTSVTIRPLIWHNWVQPYRVSGASMAPVLLPDDCILVDRTAYRSTEPKRGDVIVFVPPAGGPQDFLMRIVGVPGEMLRIKAGKVYANEKVLNETSGIPDVYYQNRNDLPYGKVHQEFKVPEDSYFVLGDNSQRARDSRWWGFVPQKDIKGKVVFICWPPARWSRVK